MVDRERKLVWIRFRLPSQDTVPTCCQSASLPEIVAAACGGVESASVSQGDGFVNLRMPDVDLAYGFFVPFSVQPLFHKGIKRARLTRVTPQSIIFNAPALSRSINKLHAELAPHISNLRRVRRTWNPPRQTLMFWVLGRPRASEKPKGRPFFAMSRGRAGHLWTGGAKRHDATIPSIPHRGGPHWTGRRDWNSRCRRENSKSLVDSDPKKA